MKAIFNVQLDNINTCLIQGGERQQGARHKEKLAAVTRHHHCDSKIERDDE